MGLAVFELQIDKTGKIANDNLIMGEPPLVERSRLSFIDWSFRRAAQEPDSIYAGATFLYKPQSGSWYKPYSFDVPLPDGYAKKSRAALPVRVTDPGYPAGASSEGAVIVQVALSNTGKTGKINVVSGPDDLRPATVKAVRNWRFFVPRATSVSARTAVVVIFFMRPKY